MNTLTTTDRTTLLALATRANEAHAAATRSMNEALSNARECGEALLQVKERLPHGEWGDWLRDNFRASHRTANGYMRIAQRWAEIAPANSQPVANIGIKEALAALSEPAEEPAVNPWTSLPVVEAMIADERFQAGIRALTAARDVDPDSFGPFLRDAFDDNADAFDALVTGCERIQSSPLEVVAATCVMLLARLDPPVMIAA